MVSQKAYQPLKEEFLDSLAAIEYISKKIFPKSHSFLIGQSLGGALLLGAMNESPQIQNQQILLAVLEGTFASYQQIMKEKMQEIWLLYPFQWISYFAISDHYAPENLITKTKKYSLFNH